jgi:hypothetical protein
MTGSMHSRDCIRPMINALAERCHIIKTLLIGGFRSFFTFKSLQTAQYASEIIYIICTSRKNYLEISAVAIFLHHYKH